MPDEFYNPREINSKTENSEKSENLETVGSFKGVSEPKFEPEFES